MSWLNRIKEKYGTHIIVTNRFSVDDKSMVNTLILIGAFVFGFMISYALFAAIDTSARGDRDHRRGYIETCKNQGKLAETPEAKEWRCY